MIKIDLTTNQEPVIYVISRGVASNSVQRTEETILFKTGINI